MKQITTLAFVFLIGSFVLEAQNKAEKRDAQDRAKYSTEKMTEELQLTELQADKALVIQQNYHVQLKDWRETQRVNRDSSKSQRMQIERTRDESLKEVLSEEQFMAYRKMKQEQRVERTQRMDKVKPSEHPKERPDRIRLDNSDD